MKLWYQSLARQTESIPYGAMLRKLIDACVDPGTEVLIRGTSETAGIGVHYRFLEYQDKREVIYNAVRAEKEGYDAFLIGNFNDIGIHEAREMVNIPVLGLFETGMHIACMMGVNFGLITVAAKHTPMKVEYVRQCGLESRLIGAEHLSTTPADLKKAMSDDTLRDKVMVDIMAAAKRLLDRGAEVIFPAGGDILVFLAQAGIYEIERAPIMNSTVELVKMGEAAVKLKKITGRFTSKRFHYAPPTGEFLKRIRDFYGPDLYPGAK